MFKRPVLVAGIGDKSETLTSQPPCPIGKFVCEEAGDSLLLLPLRLAMTLPSSFLLDRKQ
jgi:hypothetical protein